MNNKELITKIQELKSIKADEQWKARNRDFLYSQISANPADQITGNSFIEILIGVKNFFAQPSFAVVLLVALVIGGSLFGVRAINFMPGDSLYIAQRISEEAQLAITFGQENKAKLGIKFASDRAKQITEVLAQAQFNEHEQNNELKESFKNELAVVRTRLNEINDGNENPNNEMVFSADVGRDGNGLEISGQEGIGGGNEEIAPAEEPKNVEQILIEAESLFDQEDYVGAKSKIEEADALIAENNNEEENSEENNPAENVDIEDTQASSTDVNAEAN